MIKYCKACGKPFGEGIKPSALGRRKYCSYECSSLDRPSKPPKIIPCEYCGKEFGHNHRPEHTFRFCSGDCRNKSRTLENIPCPICGKMFKPKRQGKKKPRKAHCSQACDFIDKGQRKERRLQREAIEKANRNPFPNLAEQKGHNRNRVDDLIEERYPTEGSGPLAKELGLSRRWIRDRAYKVGVVLDKEQYHRTVHAKAQKYMLENNPMKREAVKQKVQEWWSDHPEVKKHFRQRQLETVMAMQKTKPSKLEFRICEILDQLGIEYEHQVIIKRGFVVDFRFSGMVILQADGEWWHGHPRFAPFTENQLRQQKRDQSQDKYLVACGYTVLRIWDSDVSLEALKELLTPHLNRDKE